MTTATHREIILCHPALPGEAFFLVLAPSDVDPTDPNRRGIVHKVALDACLIVANNRPGFLSSTRFRAGRIPDSTAVLCEPTYWYFLDDTSLPANYPVLNDFRAWNFPEEIPRHWSAARPNPANWRVVLSKSEVSNAVKASDKNRCVISRVGAHFTLQSFKASLSNLGLTLDRDPMLTRVLPSCPQGRETLVLS